MEKSKKMGQRFVGKVAIVTASTQGIGFSIAERLGLEGASVVVSSRRQEGRTLSEVVRVADRSLPLNQEGSSAERRAPFAPSVFGYRESLRNLRIFRRNVDSAVEKLRAQGIQVLGVVCHVSNAGQRKNLIDKTVEMYGKIDVVVFNAAANPSVDPLLETKESVLDKIWDINVKASILLLQDAAPHLQKGSSIVFISSITAYHPEGILAMYAVTKTALLGLTKALASEMAPNTRVNCVAPGFVPTNFAEYLTKNDAIRQSILEKTLLNRLGTTKDMAATTAFLASEDASYITGETVVVAGGLPSKL